MEERRKSLKELVAKKQIFAPIVWDVMSAKVAEAIGFEATLLSGGIMTGNCALPDLGLMSPDDVVYCAKWICEASPLPCIIDVDDGYGETPLHAYRMTKRMIDLGAMSQTLDDTTGTRGYNRWGNKFRSGSEDGSMVHPVVSREAWLAKTKAAMEAAAGTEFLNIARTEAKIGIGLDEAIERARRAYELGAEMTLVIGLSNLEEAERVAKYVPGWKMWPDVMTKYGKPDVLFEEIEPLGFNLITAHCTLKGGNFAMYDSGKKVLEARSMEPLVDYNFGYSKEELAKLNFSSGKEWLAREASYEVK